MKALVLGIFVAALAVSAVNAQRGSAVISLGPTVPQNTTVASLPSCGSVLTGAVFRVTDSLTPVLGVAVTGGGAVAVVVRCNGTAWLVGQ